MSETIVATNDHQAPRRVLVVEDSATQAAALALLLERAGYATVLARRAERALELLESASIDLVLSDVVMPGMDGYELCRRIKAQPAWSEIPVVLLTSLTDPLAIVRGLASGADHYVTKPYDAEGLLSRVRFVLERVADPKRIIPDPVEVELLGTKFVIRAMKEQILELLVSSYSDLVRTSEVVREAERRARFLAEATELLSSTLDARTVLSDLARLAVPRVADLCATDLVEMNGTRRRVAVAHSIPGIEQLIERETAREGAFFDQVGVEMEPRVIPIEDNASLMVLTADPEVRAALSDRGAQELIVVPLVARGRVLGIMQFVVLGTTRAARPDDMPLIIDVARRAALAVDNALLYEEAQRATRARDDVLAIVSHDLRNPLNTIQMSTSFLLDVLAEPGAKDVPLISQLQVMQRATRRANALIQDLLDVSRIDAGTLAVAATAIDASMLLNDAVLELEPLVLGKKLEFAHEWKGPDLLVAADRSRIAQIFSNLVGNAIKFTPAGGSVRIEGSRRGDIADFDVIDSGAGIPPEDVPHLFDRFWQASQTSRTGAGLGLFIVKGIVEAHRGSIHVESTVGKGTHFRFSIPSAVKHEA
jgi:signal transduction histidine kinase/DNA-binding response OmpR family regulator